MSEYEGKYAVTAGSYNPLHNSHIALFDKVLARYEYCICLVRYNEGVDLTDWETKLGWFERLSRERYDGRLLPVKNVPNTKEKVYGIDLFKDIITEAENAVHEPVQGYIFGEDYGGMVQKMRELYPDKDFLIFPRQSNGVCNSTEIREDLEGHKDWLPEYVYESLRNVLERQ